jgi:hypothetical protein
VAAIDSEIAVQSEHSGGRVDFREPDQAGVCQRHRPISVASHECPEIRLLFLNGKTDPNDSSI